MTQILKHPHPLLYSIDPELTEEDSKAWRQVGDSRIRDCKDSCTDRTWADGSPAHPF